MRVWRVINDLRVVFFSSCGGKKWKKDSVAFHKGIGSVSLPGRFVRLFYRDGDRRKMPGNGKSQKCLFTVE